MFLLYGLQSIISYRLDHFEFLWPGFAFSTWPLLKDLCSQEAHCSAWEWCSIVNTNLLEMGFRAGIWCERLCQMTLQSEELPKTLWRKLKHVLWPLNNTCYQLLYVIVRAKADSQSSLGNLRFYTWPLMILQVLFYSWFLAPEWYDI